MVEEEERRRNEVTREKQGRKGARGRRATKEGEVTRVSFSRCTLTSSKLAATNTLSWRTRRRTFFSFLLGFQLALVTPCVLMMMQIHPFKGTLGWG